MHLQCFYLTSESELQTYDQMTSKNYLTYARQMRKQHVATHIRSTFIHLKKASIIYPISPLQIYYRKRHYRKLIRIGNDSLFVDLNVDIHYWIVICHEMNELSVM